MEPRALPRLLYAGDVPVEASSGGALLIHRLLLAYPAERLRVLQSDLYGSHPPGRLPGVRYTDFPNGRRRFLQTRLVKFYSAWLILTAPFRTGTLGQRLGDFQPEAVLTVAHGYGWLAAAAWAAKRRVPLHLIVHDDWLTFVSAPAWLRPWIARQFGRVYRQAASRLCVSPAMAEEYERRFGVPGTVLYPGRGPEDDSDDTAKPPVAGAVARPFTLGYAGVIGSASYEQSLLQAAAALATIGGRLLIYSPSGMRPAVAAEIARQALPVDWRAARPSGEVIRILRREADALFVPMSFRAGGIGQHPPEFSRANSPTTPAWGCRCSSTDRRFVRRSAGRGKTPAPPWPSPTPPGPDLAAAIGRLAGDPAHRLHLAEGAAVAGEKYFSFDRASAIFLAAVAGSPQGPSSDAAGDSLTGR